MIATYVYQCAQCASMFELRRDVNARDQAALCPVCQSVNPQRIFTPVMIMSRGSDSALDMMIPGGGCGGCTATRCTRCPSSKN